MWRKINQNYPKRVKTVEDENLLSFGITYSLALTSCCPSPKDRKNITRLGDFFAKEKDQIKRRLDQRRISLSSLQLLFKNFFSLILSCFFRIKVEMWIPVSIKQRAIHLYEGIKHHENWACSQIFSTTKIPCGLSECKWNTLEKLVKVGSRKNWRADTSSHHEIMIVLTKKRTQSQ